MERQLNFSFATLTAFLRLRYKDAVKECTSALELQPNYARGLMRRAKAQELLGNFKLALTDILAVNNSDSASADSCAAEKRLKDLVGGSKPANGTPAAESNGSSASTSGGGGSGSLSTATTATPGARTMGSRPAGAPQNHMLTAKCTLGEETRLVHIGLNASYADLLAMVGAKFPTAGVWAFLIVC